MHFLRHAPPDPAVPYILDALFMFGNQLLLCMMDELLADLPSLWSGVRGGPILKDSLSALRPMRNYSKLEIYNILKMLLKYVEKSRHVCYVCTTHKMHKSLRFSDIKLILMLSRGALMMQYRLY